MVEEYQSFPSKNFCLTVPKSFVGNPSRFHQFRVSKNVRDKKGDGYHDFLSKLLCLTVPKVFIVEHFLISEKSRYQKFAIIGRGRVLSQFSTVSFELNNVDEGWSSNLYPPFQHPVTLPTVPWEPMVFLTNFSEIIKTMWHDRLEPGPTASEPCCTNPTAVI